MANFLFVYRGGDDGAAKMPPETTAPAIEANDRSAQTGPARRYLAGEGRTEGAYQPTP